MDFKNASSIQIHNARNIRYKNKTSRCTEQTFLTTPLNLHNERLLKPSPSFLPYQSVSHMYHASCYLNTTLYKKYPYVTSLQRTYGLHNHPLINSAYPFLLLHKHVSVPIIALLSFFPPLPSYSSPFFHSSSVLLV